MHYIALRKDCNIWSSLSQSMCMVDQKHGEIMTETADNIYFYVSNFLFNTVFVASCRDESWTLYTEKKNQTKKGDR